MVPAAVPAYGQPQAGVPGAPGQPAYGQPSYPSPMPGPSAPGKGMAISALILSFICCLDVVAIILAIVVLVRSRDGQNRGKGLAILALVVGVLTLVATVVVGVLGVNYVKDLKGVNDLRVGDCITANGLTDSKSDSIDTIRTVSCSGKHDGEVASSVTLTADQAKSDASARQQLCLEAIDQTAYTSVLSDPTTYTITALTDVNPKSGDRDACVISKADGTSLTSKLGS